MLQQLMGGRGEGEERKFLMRQKSDKRATKPTVRIKRPSINLRDPWGKIKDKVANSHLVNNPD